MITSSSFLSLIPDRNTRRSPAAGVLLFFYRDGILSKAPLATKLTVTLGNRQTNAQQGGAGEGEPFPCGSPWPPFSLVPSTARSLFGGAKRECGVGTVGSSEGVLMPDCGKISYCCTGKILSFQKEVFQTAAVVGSTCHDNDTLPLLTLFAKIKFLGKDIPPGRIMGIIQFV